MCSPVHYLASVSSLYEELICGIISYRNHFIPSPGRISNTEWKINPITLLSKSLLVTVSQEVHPSPRLLLLGDSQVALNSFCSNLSLLSSHPSSAVLFCFPLCCLGTVPTAPPQNVQVEAVNSTTIQFFWNPPPQQFINGINQGYKVSRKKISVTSNNVCPDSPSI